MRVVWHYRAADENRTFDIVYRVLGAVVIYDDVVDVNWKVWGDQWDQGVGRVDDQDFWRVVLLFYSFMPCPC